MTPIHNVDASFLWWQDFAAPPSCPLLVWENYVVSGIHPQGAHAARLVVLQSDTGRIAWEKQLAHCFVHHLAAAPHTSHLYTVLNSTDVMRGQAMLQVWDTAGQEIWSWRMPGGAQVFSRLGFSKQHFWFSADSNILWQINHQDIQEIRRYPLNLNVSWASPLVTTELIILPCKSPRLLALTHQGHRRWLYDASGHTAHWLDRTPVQVGDALVASFSRGLVVCLDLYTGHERWRVAIGPTGKELSSPISDGHLIFVGSRDGLYAISPNDGQVIWRYRTERSVTARPHLSEGYIYITGHDHRLHILAAASGELLWRSDDWRARLEESPILHERVLIAINRRGEIGGMLRPRLGADDLLRDGLWCEATVMLEKQGKARRAAEVREMFDDPIRAAYAWEKLDEWEKAAILYEAAGAWEYAAALWHVLDQPERYAEALLNNAQSAAARSLTDEEMALHWEKAALALETIDQPERAADSWRQVARYRQLPILKVTVVPERPLVKGQRTPLTLHIRNEGYGPALFPSVRASGDHFSRSKLMSTRHFKQLRDYEEVQESIFVHPVQIGDAIPLRFTIEYQDERQQIHQYRETIMVSVAAAPLPEIAPAYHLNQHETHASVIMTKGTLSAPREPEAETPHIVPPKPTEKLQSSDEVFRFYGLSTPVPGAESVTPTPLPTPPPASVPGRPIDLRIDASTPRVVTVGQPFRLAVALRQPTSPTPSQTELTQVHSGEFVLSRPRQEGDFLRLRIHVSSPDCQLHGPEFRPIRYYPGYDTTIHSFQLVPKRAGSLSILVSVLQEDDWLGDAYVNTTAEAQPAPDTGQVTFNVTSQPVDSAVEIRILQAEGSSSTYPVEMRLLDRSVFRDSWFSLNRPELLKHTLNAHQYGQALGKMLFTGELESDYRQAVSVLETEGGRLHVRLWLDEQVLHELGWERLYHPWQTMWDRLGSNARTPFSRFVVAQNFTRPRPLTERPIRLLAVLASPEDIEYFNLTPIPASERDSYKALWRELPGVALTILESGTDRPPTMKAIREAMIEGQHIVHFLGHGALGKQGVTLYLENEAGQTDLVKSDRILGAVRAAAHPPLLINLTTCESGRYDGFIPLAPRLVAEGGTQAVLAMNGRIQVDTAHLFTEQFYRRLFQHGLVDLATNEGRALIHDQADWGVPVLFSRLTDNQLLGDVGA